MKKYYILSFNFRQTQQYTNRLTHISLCIIEFIGHTMSLHVSAHGVNFRRYINKLTLLNYAFYMDPYISLSLLYAQIVFCTALKVLNKYLNLLQVLNIKLNS
jgi:hypothetical protein